MKKLIAALLVIALLVVGAMSLVACNKDNGNYLVVGITDYAPFDYLEDGEWTGFDAEVAKLVAKDLGYDGVKFVEIDWDYKITELTSKKIDCIWNGMTVSDELGQSMIFSKSYATNYQVVVTKTTNKTSYDTIAKISASTAKVASETGSAGEKTIDAKLGKNITKIDCAGQTKALMEVQAGTSDLAVVDFCIANALCGKEGYDKISIVTEIDFEDAEEFGIGFRKEDTELRDKVNALLVKYYADGTLTKLQKQFGEDSIALLEIK